MSMLDLAKLEQAKNKIRIAQESCNNTWYSLCCDTAINIIQVMISGDNSYGWYCPNTTRSILGYVLSDKNIRTITETDEFSELHDCQYKNMVDYQCDRFRNLFKTVYSDGTVKYDDTNRIGISDIYNRPASRNICYSLVAEIINEILPITLPYSPYCVDVWIATHSAYLENDEFDTVFVIDAKTSNGIKIDINRLFKKDGESRFVEISKEEYDKRCMLEYNRMSQQTYEERNKMTKYVLESDGNHVLHEYCDICGADVQYHARELHMWRPGYIGSNTEIIMLCKKCCSDVIKTLQRNKRSDGLFDTDKLNEIMGVETGDDNYE